MTTEKNGDGAREQGQGERKLVLDAHVMRRLAESADGQREEKLELTLDPDVNEPPKIRKKPKDGERHQKVPLAIDVFTRMTNSAHVNNKIESVCIKPPYLHVVDGKPPKWENEVARIFDALFWSESAVEKFMFGYYLRTLTREQFDSLRAAYYDRALLPPSDSPHLAESPMAAMILSVTRSTDDFVILGFGHLPTSDYGEIDDDGALTSISVITPAFTAPIRIYFASLATFLDPSRARAGESPATAADDSSTASTAAATDPA